MALSSLDSSALSGLSQVDTDCLSLPNSSNGREIWSQSGSTGAPVEPGCVGHLKPHVSPFEDVTLQNKIGAGSYASVYRGEWQNSAVAIKVFNWSRNEAESYKTSGPAFEAQLSANLSHPNLVQTYKYSARELMDGNEDVCGYEAWIVQELCDRGTLSSYCVGTPRIDEVSAAEVRQMFLDITGGASYLHSRGIIHGDLSANNVLLQSSAAPKGYNCKLADFGLSRVLDGDNTGIFTKQVGTITYMPPELFTDEEQAKLTTKVDVYAIGIILWQVITGKVPFEGKPPTMVVVMVGNGKRLELPEGVPEDLIGIYGQCTARDRHERPTSDDLCATLATSCMASLMMSGG